MRGAVGDCERQWTRWVAVVVCMCKQGQGVFASLEQVYDVILEQVYDVILCTMYRGGGGVYAFLSIVHVWVTPCQSITTQITTQLVLSTQAPQAIHCFHLPQPPLGTRVCWPWPAVLQRPASCCVY